MATSTRKKAPARLAIAIGSLVATAGFMFAVLNGPQPNSAQAAVVAPPTVSSPVAQSVAGYASRVSQTNSAPPSSRVASAPQPRLRTRGS
jgi:hypothetical protein